MTTLVRVYRNLNNGKISILDKKTNKVEMASFYRQTNKQPIQTLITCTVNSDGSMQAKIK